MAARFFTDILPDTQQCALRALSDPVTARGFYLAGGTALALQLGHRRSVDFDWFRTDPILDAMQLAAELRDHSPALQITGTSSNTLHGELDGVRMSWITYAYAQLEAPVPMDEFGCRLASIRDIAAMKLAAVAQRSARKDFFDLVAIERSGLGLAGMLDAYRAKFAVADIGHVLVSLTWFDDAESDPSPILDCEDDWDSVKAAIRSWIKAL